MYVCDRNIVYGKVDSFHLHFSHATASFQGDPAIPRRMSFDQTSRLSRRSGLRTIGHLLTLPWISLLPSLSTHCTTAVGAGTVRRTIRVGPDDGPQGLSKAARIASDGDIVEVAPGDYRRDTAIWTQRDLVIRGVGVQPRLIADGASAEGKAIFVVRGDRIRIENLAFIGAKVRDRNGAGIRLEKGRLELSGCHFEENENGLLAGNDERAELSIDRCSFIANGAGDGKSHNLYVGAIGKLDVSSSYFARARVGHLFKSRARENRLVYCRLTGEDGTSSYELEFPNGGVVEVLGCLIQQGPKSENATIISYGAEGYRWSRNELQMAFNTIVNDRSEGGTFVHVAPGKVKGGLVDNLLVGNGALDVKTDTVLIRNSVGIHSDFADALGMEFHLRKSSRLVGAAGTVGQLPPGRSYPEREYAHPANSRELPAFAALTPLSPGAFQRLAD